MRTTPLIVLVLLVGCTGKSSQNKRETEPEKTQPNASNRLPVSTVPRDHRAGADSLWSHYARKDAPPHPLEGKRGLFHLDYGAFASTDSDGKPVIEFFSEKGFKQPRIIARLTSETGWKKGSTSSVYVEGVLRGAPPIKSLPWAAPWHNLPGQLDDRLAGRIIVIDEGQIVAAP